MQQSFCVVIKGMPRGVIGYYLVAGKKFTISDLMSYQGVLDLLKSREGKGSKWELLRELLIAGKVKVGNLTGPGAVLEGLYGSQ